MIRLRAKRPALLLLLPLVAAEIVGLAGAVPARAQAQAVAGEEPVLVNLDFDNAELSEVIDLIARLTNKNFIYDDRVRGRVTIISPSKVSIEQAYAVFESVLQVKGFTTVESPGGAVKVIPIREAKETSVETVRSGEAPPDRDRFVTRLIPLRYIEAEPIVNTLKPLVSKDAAMAAYPPTNTVILTESAANIRRILGILEAIDAETYREALAVIKLEHADAAQLADQLTEIFGGTSGGDAATRLRTRRTAARTAPQTPTVAIEGLEVTRVRIITDERTNSLIVLAPKAQLDDVRRLVAQLDVPVTGGGRVHVYYLNHANAEDLASTLNSLITGQPRASRSGTGAAGGTAPLPGGGQAQNLRVQVSELAEGITITADPATNALVIQATKEGYGALSQVIEKLDVERPQVLVEALIMEVDITHSQDLGFTGVIRFINGDTEYRAFSTTRAVETEGGTGATAGGIAGGLIGGPLGANVGSQVGRFLFDSRRRNPDGSVDQNDNGTVIDGIIRASASNGNLNILSAPHILTSDNEEAEISVGNNIPIISSRVESAQGQTTGLASSVNVERQDIGVTLRVTPQITEGETLRLEIFQEITDVNNTLTQSFGAGAAQDVGVALSKRKVENTVVVSNSETVVIGGLISDAYDDTIDKVPFLGDIPGLGWAFKSTRKSRRKVNLLVFLTPHIIRRSQDLELSSIRKRQEFTSTSGEALEVSEADVAEERARLAEGPAAGLGVRREGSRDLVRQAIVGHEARYPLERMQEIEQEEREAQERAQAAAAAAERRPGYLVQAALFGDEAAATETLTRLIDAGYDGTLVASERAGSVFYEVRIGPYPSYDAAQQAADVIRGAYGLAPSVLVQAPEGTPR